jgi:hypothetical protein
MISVAGPEPQPQESAAASRCGIPFESVQNDRGTGFDKGLRDCQPHPLGAPGDQGAMSGEYSHGCFLYELQACLEWSQVASEVISEHLGVGVGICLQNRSQFLSQLRMSQC